MREQAAQFRFWPFARQHSFLYYLIWECILTVYVLVRVRACPTLSLSSVFWDVREAIEMVSGWLLASP